MLLVYTYPMDQTHSSSSARCARVAASTGIVVQWQYCSIACLPQEAHCETCHVPLLAMLQSGSWLPTQYQRGEEGRCTAGIALERLGIPKTRREVVEAPTTGQQRHSGRRTALRARHASSYTRAKGRIHTAEERTSMH